MLTSSRIPLIVRGHGLGIVWRVEVPGKACVFMRLPSDAALSEYVVYADGDAFYQAWLNLPTTHYQRCRPSRENLPDDRKYHWAVEGFEGSHDSPVPLAEISPISCGDGRTGITFTDGMTRSMWLLSNNVAVFPVLSCSERDAKVLFDAIGYQGMDIINLSDF